MRSEQAPAILLDDYKKPDYRVIRVDLDFKLAPEATLVENRMVLERGAEVAAGTPLVLDGDELTLDAIEVNGVALGGNQYVLGNSTLTIVAPPNDQQFEVRLCTRINPTANTKLMGLYRSGGNYCTQCEAEGFRRITFFVDRPDVLAVYTTRIEADLAECPLLLGNGNPLSHGKLENGRHFALWHDPHPKPSYLFALVAGDLGSIHKDFTTASGRMVKLGIYMQKGKESQAEYAMDALVRAMKWDEEVFGCEYDLDVFNIVAVSDFNMGAMENKGLNVFNDKYVLADPQTATDSDYADIESIIAHEYFHNWTGNRITCRDWFQLCLKEGLTVYRDQEFSCDQRSRAVQRIEDARKLVSAQFPEDAGPLAHPVRPQSYREINNFYTATVYEKGAEVVRMFKTMLGAENFDKGIRLYLKRHDGEAATIEQFIRCFEDVSGRELSQFARWYHQAGTPVVTVSARYDRASKQFVVELEQSLKPTPGQRVKKLMHIPMRIGLIDPSGQEVVAEKITGTEHEGDVFQLTKRSHAIVFHGIKSRPSLSINRGFSAPVIVDFEPPKKDLAHLAAHDSDLFNRAQALRDYSSSLLIRAARALSAGKAPKWDEAFVAAALAIASDKQLEPAFRALALVLPSESEVAQAIGKNVDPDAIHRAIKALVAELGKAVVAARGEILAGMSKPSAFSPDAVSAGERALRNHLLTLGVVANDEDAEHESLKQFDNADNMTDRFAAFQRIVRHHASQQDRQHAIDRFYRDYSDNHIVLDKWFSVQAMEAGEDAAERVRKLMTHPKFSLTNPNRVRSVIGMFAMGNATGFNAANGNGYRLVAEMAGEIDKINPQVSARLLTAFRSFRSLESGRRNHAFKALKSLSDKGGLSRDASDILERTLTQPE